MDLSSILLFEVSWEVCRQIGGIYRVIRTKAPVMKQLFGTNYCLIGPDFFEQSNLEFEEMAPYGVYQKALEKYWSLGFRARFGKWLITGSPNVILIDYLSQFHRIQEYKYYFWVDHGIETPDEMWVNDSVLFGYQVATLIEMFANVINEEGNSLQLITHFHEWNVGSTIPILRKRQVKTKIVFTTHATLLARYIAPTVDNIYEYMKYIDPYEEARRLNIFSQYLIERASAYGADVFTTVSDITAEETKYLLHKSVHLVTPNGLNIQKFVVAHEHQNLHGLFKAKIHDFITGYFFPYYTFDLDKTLYIFISGRYEFRNKGIDMFIDALPILNEKIQKNQLSVTVVAFIITKAATLGYRYEVLQNRFIFEELQNATMRISQNIPQRLLQQLVEAPNIQPQQLLTESELVYLKRIYYSWKRKGLPSVVTHEMVHPNDIILNYIYKNQLFNQKELAVKVVYHPDFISEFGSIIKIDYMDFIRGTHLGVFPSYYEPWGYTPMECTAAGIPSISSDWTGFSSFLQEQLPNHDEYGIFILPRKSLSYWDSVHLLADKIYSVISMSRRERIELRNKVESVSSIFDWSNLIKYYLQAYKLALSK
ncbi:MAG: hypothetical protein NZ853_02150 [Leptospiraceae bacterium]|nr:hypothetical protein [Leptospiraceae bacterium]MDW7975972.1 hypothetical protein [Leptospiraceae bacterium]